MELIEFAAKRFLLEPQHVHRVLRDRRYAIQLVEIPLRNALISQCGENGPNLIKRHYEVTGEDDAHSVDLGVAQNRLYIACQGHSFQIQNERELNKDLKLTAYAIRDIKQKYPKLPFGVVMIPPIRETAKNAKVFEDRMEDYRAVSSRFERLGAETISESLAGDWASENIRKYVPEIAAL